MEKIRGLLSIIVGITIVSVFLFGGNANAEDPKIISLGAGGATGTNYPMMAGLAEILTNELKEIKNATAQVTAGSFEMVRLVQKGYLHFSTANAASVYYGYRGAPPFRTKLDKLRTICWGQGSDTHLVVLRDSKVKKWDDIINNRSTIRISVGAPGSGAAVMMELIFKLYGLTYKDFNIDFLTWADAMNALKDRRIDVATVIAGIPSTPVMDAAMTHDIRILTVPDDIVNRLLEKYPVYATYVIPRGTYRGIDEDLKVISSKATFNCTVDLSEELVNKVTSTLHKSIPWLAENVHVAFKRYEFNPDIQRLAPLHPGAVKFYKELGKLQ